MTGFSRVQGALCADGVPLADIAETYGTPCFVYSAAYVRARYAAFTAAFDGTPHRICYAVKANSNLSLLQLLSDLGAGFDIVSGGELERVMLAVGDASKVVFSGVGKTVQELHDALDAGIGCFNVESAAELDRLARHAEARGVVAPVSIRVNPDVDAGTHPYISTGLKENKFGVSIADARLLYRQIQDSASLEAVGVDSHIGSQLTDVTPFLDATDRVLALVDDLAAEGIVLRHLDVGGGLGVRYAQETAPDLAAYAAGLRERLGDRDLELVFEPGRWLVAEGGCLLTRVELTKTNEGRRFLVVDAAMNDLLRPALYQAWHEIETVAAPSAADAPRADVVGPVCESADFLGKDRALDANTGDLLAVLGAGAYGFGMSSNYNTRPRAPEVLVDAGVARLVRRRETVDELLAGELDLLDGSDDGS